ncbi:MAG: right-handed parallel beta-helix repeat-containing protein [Pedosphaera sp.]|nr:right-handed parallel beta-helix repeat-containing protein [Pedosphaera sp.]
MNALIACAVVGLTLLFSMRPSAASVINLGPADGTTGYTKIEAARAGDEVVIAPGTYAFRVHLTAKGSAANPIYIRAQDPSNKPVWDLSATLVENAPGSYGAGDRGRGGWQVDGGTGYHISCLVFTGCHTASANSAAIRYYNGATNLLLRDCVFRNNDNGITGGTQNSEATVEFCEFATNGNLSASSPTHNMYIYGGAFTLRYCYVHDSLQAQNFHVRAQNAVLEYNWFARAASGLEVLIAYDDLDAGMHAKDLCDRLGQQLNPVCKLNIRLWRLSMLKIPEVMQTAAREAARAALIIVAASGKENLPSPVKTWMGMVIGAKNGAGGALVAQFHGVARTVKKLTPAYAYLKRIARGAGMDFFSEVIEPVDDGIACSIAAIQKRACTRTAVLDAILQQR